MCTFVGVRHVADIRADDMSKEAASIQTLQTGSNKGASQAGMAMGGVRHAADIKADDMDKTGQSVLGLQVTKLDKTICIIHQFFFLDEKIIHIRILKSVSQT